VKALADAGANLDVQDVRLANTALQPRFPTTIS